MWDVFAVSTYFTVSLIFWYIGLVPDLAVMRDRAKTRIRQVALRFVRLGWTGSNRHWSNYEKAYLILAGLSTPLVCRVHSHRVVGLRGVAIAGLAYDHFPALLRGGRDFLRIWDGADAVDSAAEDVQFGGHDHDAAHRRDVQGDAGHGIHRGLRLRHGSFHRLVQRQPL